MSEKKVDEPQRWGAYGFGRFGDVISVISGNVPDEELYSIRVVTGEFLTECEESFTAPNPFWTREVWVEHDLGGEDNDDIKEIIRQCIAIAEALNEAAAQVKS